MRVAAVMSMLAALAAPVPSSAQAGTAAARQLAADVRDLNACLAQPGLEDERVCVDRIAAPCLEEPDAMSTLGTVACLAREEAAWDRLLNAAYQRALAAASPAEANALRVAQRQWLATRDADMRVFAAREGSIQRVLAAGHRAEQVAHRALFLRGLVMD